MAIGRIENINTTLFKLLESFSNDIHYISPDDKVFERSNNYIAFSYEKSEDFTYTLNLNTWTKNEDIEWLEEILEILINNLDKRILFANGLSFRFYYANKGEIEVLENSDIIGRKINFEMKIC